MFFNCAKYTKNPKKVKKFYATFFQKMLAFFKVLWYNKRVIRKGKS